MSPALMVFLALTIVRHGLVNAPLFPSLPAVPTKKILPARTVNGSELLLPVAVWTTMLPVVAAGPMVTAILVSDHSLYAAALPLPIVTVDAPCESPKRLP